MGNPVIRANVLPTPPLVVRLELTDTDGRERVRNLYADLLTFKEIWDPERNLDIPEGSREEQARATALIFLNQLTDESWAWLSSAAGCSTREAALDWLIGQPVGSGAFRAAIDLGDKLVELSHPEAAEEEKKKLLGNRPGIMFLLISVAVSGWILAAWKSGLPGELWRFIRSFA